MSQKVGVPIVPPARSAAADRLFTETEAAEFLGTSVRSLQRFWATRQIAAVKVGRKVRFARADLDDFVAAHRVEAVR